MALSNETGKKKGAPLPAPRRRADPNEDFAHDDEVEDDEAPVWNPAARKPVAVKRKAAASAAQDPHTGCYEDLVDARAKVRGRPFAYDGAVADFASLSLSLPGCQKQEGLARVSFPGRRPSGGLPALGLADAWR